MLALIDADLVAYRCAASAENDPEEIAYIRADRLLKDILSATDASEYKLFLSGSSNFRHEIYPAYKANRKDMKRPKWLQQLREYLVLEWNAEVTDGYEADDALGIAMSQGKEQSVVCCSLDKDLRQLPGNHYNFVTGNYETISELEGWRNFYTQLVLGDRADNVPGYDGKMRPAFPKFLTETREALVLAKRSYGMYGIVRALYEDEQILIRNARLLYLLRKEGEVWQPPTEAETSLEVKVEEAVNLESMPMKQVEITQSTARGGTKRKKGGSPRRGTRKALRLVKTNLEV